MNDLTHSPQGWRAGMWPPNGARLLGAGAVQHLDFWISPSHEWLLCDALSPVGSTLALREAKTI
jgi:hypothetical protein